MGWRSTTVRVLRAAAVIIVAVAALMPAAAFAADGSTLDLEQETLAEQLEHKFIAPCCYTQTVAVHQSQAADQVKQQIRLLIAQGADETEVTDTLVAQYGEQVLAAPTASGFNFFAYALPALGILAGLGAIVLIMTRWRALSAASRNVSGRTVVASATAGSTRSAGSSRDEEDRELERRLEEELSSFDG